MHEIPPDAPGRSPSGCPRRRDPAARLLGAALLWAALTQANLVVRGAGRVRPVDTPEKVFSGARADVLSASTGGRVVAVHFKEGDEVKEGALLIRLDTDHVDNQIAKQRRMIQATEEELANLRRL